MRRWKVGDRVMFSSRNEADEVVTQRGVVTAVHPGEYFDVSLLWDNGAIGASRSSGLSPELSSLPCGLRCGLGVVDDMEASGEVDAATGDGMRREHVEDVFDAIKGDTES